MAKIVSKKVTWTKSVDADVVSHNVYCVPESQTLDYNSPKANVLLPTTEYVMPGIFTITSGNYKVGVTAQDNVGNESDILSKIVPFHFTAPAAPTNLLIV